MSFDNAGDHGMNKDNVSTVVHADTSVPTLGINPPGEGDEKNQEGSKVAEGTKSITSGLTGAVDVPEARKLVIADDRDNGEAGKVSAMGREAVPVPAEHRLRAPNPGVEFVQTGLERLAWQAADTVSAGLSPLGPVVVRGLYIGKQIVTMVQGTCNGDGFNLKVSIPGMDLPLEDLHAKLEILTRLRVGGQTSDRPDAGVHLEAEFYEPPTGDGDVGSSHRPSASTARHGILPAPTAEYIPPTDPWAVWLDLAGTRLIHNLSWALTYVAGLPAGTVETSIRIGARPERLPENSAAD